jgi:hypothetical protein
MRYADDYAITGRSRRKVLDLRKPHQRVTAAASGFPWNKCDFGYVRTGDATFTIKAGEIQIGTNAPITATETGITINTDGAFVGWQYRISINSLTIEYLGTSIVYEADYIKKWLYRFSLNGEGVAHISRYGFMNPSLPAVFGSL